MRWFRFYAEALNDPKVQRLPPALFKHWVNILCIACESDDDGKLPNEDDIAFALRVKPSEARAILTQLGHAGLVDRTPEGREKAATGPREGRWMPHNWPQRQRASDDIAARVRKHRERQAAPEAAPKEPSGANVTLHETLQHRFSNVTATPPEEDVDAERDTDADPDPEGGSSPTVIDKGKVTADGEGGGSGGDPQAFALLCVQVAQAAHLKAYDQRLLAQCLARYRSRASPNDLLAEAGKAAEWMGEHPKRAMNVRFLDNWLKKAFRDEVSNQHGDIRGPAASNGSRAGGTTAAIPGWEEPDPTANGKYAAFIRNRANTTGGQPEGA